MESLRYADEQLRFALMINLVETAAANDEVDPNEQQAIFYSKQSLGVSHEQLSAIINFVKQMKKIRARGLDDDQAADAIKAATAGLGAVGIPIAAVYFSGSVLGLSAAGITSGLAALGLGLGMVPGIGVAILVGAGIFLGVSSALDLGGNRAKEELRLKQERKAQLVIQNMQGAINQLIDQILDLQTQANRLEASASEAEANREAIRILTERLRFMKQSITKRKQAIENI